MSYPDYRFLRLAVEGRVLTVTMSRPEALNALSQEAHSELSGLAQHFADDPDVDVLLITGEGRGFSVGGDRDLLERLTQDADTRASIEREARHMITSLVNLEKPVVVALNGYAMGGGLAFALMADIVVAARQAQIADGHMLAAIAAGDGGVLTWPLYTGLLRAKRWLLTGDFISAEEAAAIGLVTEVVDTDECMPRAREYAHRLAALPQAPIRATKSALNQWQKLGLPIFEMSLRAEIANLASDESREVIDEYLNEYREGTRRKR